MIHLKLSKSLLGTANEAWLSHYAHQKGRIEPPSRSPPIFRHRFIGVNIAAVQETGDTPLSLAAYFGRPKAVAELVRRGADVNCRDREGLAPGEAFERGVGADVQRQIQVPTNKTQLSRQIVGDIGLFAQ